MNPHIRDWIEKTLVQATALVAVLVAWFAVWRWVRPWDPGGALVFVPHGDIGRLAVFAVMVWALAAGCAAATIWSRPEGSLLAALAGTAALGLHSGGMDELLKYSEGHLRGTFLAMTGEMLLMGAVLVVAAMIVAVVRAMMSRLLPRLAWHEPAVETLAPPEKRPVAAPSGQGAFGSPLLQAIRDWRREGRTQSRTTLAWAAQCLVIELAVATLLLVVTFRSDDMGQIAFALAASFGVGAFAAHSAFPIRTAVPFWMAPVIMGAAILAMGGVAAAGAGPEWHKALLVARQLPIRAALPVHWLGFACGGAVAGYWASRRLYPGEKADEAAGNR